MFQVILNQSGIIIDPGLPLAVILIGSTSLVVINSLEEPSQGHSTSEEKYEKLGRRKSRAPCGIQTYGLLPPDKLSNLDTFWWFLFVQWQYCKPS